MAKSDFTSTAADGTEVELEKLKYKYVSASNQWNCVGGIIPAVDISTLGDAQINGLDNIQRDCTTPLLASDLGVVDGGTLTVPANFWIWSDDTACAAITLDVPNMTLINSGNIIGKGGDGGTGSATGRTSNPGGPAISVTATGVTITNEAGAYIAGGGGGGAGLAGGGGAGGGNGSTGPINSAGGTGGSLGQSGNDGAGANAGNGGTAGGTGGGYTQTPYAGGGGGGGGRVLPGSTTLPDGVSAGPATYFGGSGGGPGEAGDAAQASGLGYAHGGGGWGAAGGDGTYGGAGGAAISTTETYTLNDSGTIYGAT